VTPEQRIRYTLQEIENRINRLLEPAGARSDSGRSLPTSRGAVFEGARAVERRYLIYPSQRR
jgi:hypothetical protein